MGHPSKRIPIEATCPGRNSSHNALYESYLPLSTLESASWRANSLKNNGMMAQLIKQCDKQLARKAWIAQSPGKPGTRHNLPVLLDGGFPITVPTYCVSAGAPLTPSAGPRKRPPTSSERSLPPKNSARASTSPAPISTPPALSPKRPTTTTAAASNCSTISVPPCPRPRGCPPQRAGRSKARLHLPPRATRPPIGVVRRSRVGPVPAQRLD